MSLLQHYSRDEKTVLSNLTIFKIYPLTFLRSDTCKTNTSIKLNTSPRGLVGKALLSTVNLTFKTDGIFTTPNPNHGVYKKASRQRVKNVSVLKMEKFEF